MEIRFLFVFSLIKNSCTRLKNLLYVIGICAYGTVFITIVAITATVVTLRFRKAEIQNLTTFQHATFEEKDHVTIE